MSLRTGSLSPSVDYTTSYKPPKYQGPERSYRLHQRFFLSQWTNKSSDVLFERFKGQLLCSSTIESVKLWFDNMGKQEAQEREVSHLFGEVCPKLFQWFLPRWNEDSQFLQDKVQPGNREAKYEKNISMADTGPEHQCSAVSVVWTNAKQNDLCDFDSSLMLANSLSGRSRISLDCPAERRVVLLAVTKKTKTTLTVSKDWYVSKTGQTRTGGSCKDASQIDFESKREWRGGIYNILLLAMYMFAAAAVTAIFGSKWEALSDNCFVTVVGPPGSCAFSKSNLRNYHRERESQTKCIFLLTRRFMFVMDKQLELWRSSVREGTDSLSYPQHKST